MRKYLSLAFLTSILFLFASCGMPTYHDYQDEIAISSVSSVGGVSYKAGFRLTLSDSTILDTLDSKTPSILLMYSLYPQGVSPSFSSQFLSYYKGGSSTHHNGSPAVFDDGRLSNVEYTYEGTTLHLYGMTGEDGSSLYDAPQYTYGPINWWIEDSNNEKVLAYPYWYFMIDVSNSNTTDSSFNFVLDVWKADSSGNAQLVADDIQLYSYAGQPFYAQYFSSISNRLDYEYYREQSQNEDIYVNLFCACCVLPGDSSDYSNIYWSSLTSDSFSI